VRWRRRTGSDHGVASLEFVTLVPLLILVTDLGLQGGAAMWAVSAADNAARQGARAQSLGLDVQAACTNSLPAGVQLVHCNLVGDLVEVEVAIVKVSPLPAMTVTRSAEMPPRPA
jgi:Flp pilus assembly protein TadG